ncbi:Ig-like domain-containing protein [Streptomyces sp. NBC_01800]|uniref:Ig-like domain-containing protein n=1 Tax=Streptomyces sp. NBC_01800 TaxID=2975945 RepID=UPI002DD9E023|nr:Ig-like domain-containing protein [Streptomyces sp. NBC_01800]WSA69964.1 Ig-like domain-containing protein [Streptomyces sp. NBC_01800]
MSAAGALLVVAGGGGGVGAGGNGGNGGLPDATAGAPGAGLESGGGGGGGRTSAGGAGGAGGAAAGAGWPHCPINVLDQWGGSGGAFSGATAGVGGTGGSSDCVGGGAGGGGGGYFAGGGGGGTAGFGTSPRLGGSGGGGSSFATLSGAGTSFTPSPIGTANSYGRITISYTLVDITPPAAPVITAPVDGSTLGDSTPDFVGTGEVGSKVAVTDAGGTVCTATVDTSGKWACTPGTALADGKHTITSTATDEAGNTSQGRPITIVIDTKPPAAPVITAPVDGGTLGDSTPDFVGTGEVGSKVAVTDAGSTVCTATVDTSGKWACTPGTALADGKHTITSTATDEAGNISQGRPITIVIDTKPPAAPVITAPGDGGTLGDSTPDFVGTGEVGSKVAVTDAGSTVCTATVDTSGKWACTPGTALVEGEHTITATATDGAGNTSQGGPITITIAPITPVITAPVDGSTLRHCSERGRDVGERAGRGGCLLTFTGTGGAGDTVTVTEGSKQICSATVNDAGTWSCSGRTRRTGGEHTFIAIATGSTGATATSEPVTVELRHRPHREWPYRSLATTAPGVRESGVTNKRFP